MGWRGRIISVISVLLLLSLSILYGMFQYQDRLPDEALLLLEGIVGLIILAGAYWSGRQYDKAAFYMKMNKGSIHLIEGLVQKEKELRESESRYKNLLEQIPDAVFVYCDGKMVYWNTSGQEMFKHESLEKLDVESLLELIHPDDYESYAGWRVAAEPEPSKELRIRRSDGTYIEAELVIRPILYQDKKAYQAVVRDLTEIKRNGRKLIEAQRELREVLRYQQGITFKFTQKPQGFVHTLWEGELAGELGLAPATVTGRTLESLFPAKLAEKLEPFYRRAWDRAESVAFETVLGDKHCLVTLKPILRSGRVEEVVGYFTDITLRKRTEEELLQAKEMLESFFNNTTDAIDVVDLEGHLIHVNVAFEELFGWTYSDTIGRKLTMIVPSDLRMEEENLRELVRYGGHVSGYETKRYRKNGELFDVSVTVSPIRNDEGDTIAIASISRDITEAKQVENALRRSEAKYRLIAENMSDIIAVLSQEGTIDYISPSCKYILGMEPEIMTGCLAAAWAHSEDLEKLRGLIESLDSSGAGGMTDVQIRHAEGHWINMEVSVRKIPSLDGGESPNVLIVARDITERKKAEELLRKSEKLSVVGQLAAGVAHEIRNPLTSLKGFLQLLKERNAGDGFFFEVMLSELERINTIVSEFLVLAKPQNTKFKKQHINRIVREVVSFLEGQAILGGVEMVCEFLTSGDPEVVCDENQLKQVFINLLKNAVEAMTKGGIVKISVMEPAPGRVLIRFADQGPGIPPERLEKLGEPFYTTKEKGTGLGLMVSFRIIEDHGGTVKVTSELDAGTVFDVMLPAFSPEHAALHKAVADTAS